MAAPIHISLAQTTQDIDAVRQLSWDYRSHLLAQPPIVSNTIELFYDMDTYARVMANLEPEFTPPHGAMVLATSGGTPLGCGMFHRFDSHSCEWKRIYVAPQARGLGLARKICAEMTTLAQAAGYSRILLDTSIGLTAARALYADLGFRERDAYYTVPEAAQGKLCFFEKEITNDRG